MEGKKSDEKSGDGKDDQKVVKRKDDSILLGPVEAGGNAPDRESKDPRQPG